MTENELWHWRRYAARRMLPQRRVELYLAQIAMCVAKLGGAGDTTLSDFMFDPLDDEADDDEDSAEAEAAFFDFKPRRKE